MLSFQSLLRVNHIRQLHVKHRKVSKAEIVLDLFVLDPRTLQIDLELQPRLRVRQRVREHLAPDCLQCSFVHECSLLVTERSDVWHHLDLSSALLRVQILLNPVPLGKHLVVLHLSERLVHRRESFEDKAESSHGFGDSGGWLVKSCGIGTDLIEVKLSAVNV